jgi:hypothetical protein
VFSFIFSTAKGSVGRRSTLGSLLRGRTACGGQSLIPISEVMDLMSFQGMGLVARPTLASTPWHCDHLEDRAARSTG